MRETQTRKPPTITSSLYERQKRETAQCQREHKKLVAAIKRANQK
jgi:hypothetical protein